jgi:hypothetical protein
MYVSEAREGTEGGLGPARDDGKIKKRPALVGELLGKPKWEKPLADWIVATGVGLLGNELRDNGEERVERNGGWRREPFF